MSVVETKLVCVQRVLDYGQLQSEAPLDLPSDTTSMLDKGSVTFRNVWLRYGPENNFILQGINVSIEAGEKVQTSGE